MEMIKKEWQAIFKNKILLISFVVISFIPILYASFFLRSVWDPYGKTGNLPVAVVNEDKEVTYNDETLKVGEELVDQLKENEDLNWNFVSKQEAKEGLENHTYYMVITIPENFSANAATVMDDQPQKMDIQYETNGALNYLGEVIGETAMKQLKSEVSSKVTEVYAKAIFEQLSEIADGFSDAADGAGQLDDGAVKLSDGSQTLVDGLNTLAESTITFSDGEDTFSVALNKYLEGTLTLDDGLVQLKEGVDTLGEKVPDLADGVKQLDDGSSKLSSGIKDYTNGVSKLADGTGTLAENGTTLKTGVSTLVNGLSDGTAKLQDGATQINSGLSQMSEQLGTQIDGSQAQLAQLDQGLTDINQGLQSLNQALNGSSNTAVDVSSITGLLTNIGTSAQTAGGVAGQIVASADDINSNVSSINGEVTEYLNNDAQFQGLSEGDRQTVINAVNNAFGASGSIATISNTASDIASQSNTVLASAGEVGKNVGELGNAMQTLSTTLNSAGTLASSVQKLAQGSAVALPGAQQAIAQLCGGLTTVKTALDGQLIPGMTQLETGITSLQSGLDTGSTKLSTGLNTYIAGVEQVNDGVQKLNDNSAKLSSGATTLSEGLGKLNDNVPTLQEGVEALVKGTTTIKQGSSKLVENNSKLLEGQNKLTDASHKLVDGSAKLSEGGNTLSEGLGTLTEGSNELASALSEGSEKVNDVHTSDKTAQMIAQPNQITQEKYSEVPNYGHALAPYVLSLALYVGCLVFNFIFPIRKIAVKEKSAFSWWLSKMSVGLVSATAMAIVEASIMMVIGLEPSHRMEYFIITLFSAYAYMFLIMFLAMAFDNPGRFIAMVMLILQLAGSGGTFPVQLTDHFFQAIHPYLPMTHSIYGFREAISSGLGNATFVDNAIILLAIAVVSQALLFVSMKVLKKFHKDGSSQLDDNQKLLDDDYDYSYQ